MNIALFPFVLVVVCAFLIGRDASDIGFNIVSSSLTTLVNFQLLVCVWHLLLGCLIFLNSNVVEKLIYFRGDRKQSFYLKLAVPQCCPVCESYISETEIFDHVFGHCDMGNKSVHELKSWLRELFSSSEMKLFSMDISCIKCNYTCQFDNEFLRHIVGDHVTCSCRFECKEFCSLFDHLRNSTENSKCKIVCPLCDSDKFDEENIFSFPIHVSRCVPKTISNTDISDLYPLCIYCSPAKRVLFTKLKAHLQNCHSININTVFCAPRKKLSIPMLHITPDKASEKSS